MSESIFKSIIEEYAEREFNSYPETTDHKFSYKHRLKMKKIFKVYERNAAALRKKDRAETALSYAPALPKRKHISAKLILIITILIFLALISGCFLKPDVIFTDFTGREYPDHTEIRPKNINNAPETIEKKYVLTDIPEGFEIRDEKEDVFGVGTEYINHETNQHIWFDQRIKKTCGVIHLNTDQGKLVEVDINGHRGLLLEAIIENDHFTDILWDDGDYILELFCYFDKNTTLNLAKSAKLSETE